MKFIQYYMANKEDFHKLIDFINGILEKEKDSQIFIANEIVEEILNHNIDYQIYRVNAVKTYHYMVDQNNFGGEEYYDYTEGGFCDKLIAQFSLISNCQDYKQLVTFETKKCRYKHFLSGVQQIVYIMYENK